MFALTEVEAGQVFGGTPGLHMELLTEKERVRIVRALRNTLLEEAGVDPDAGLDEDGYMLLLKLADPGAAVWVQHRSAIG